MRRLLLALVLSAACGDDVYTWGDVSSRMAVLYCEQSARCGYILNDYDLRTCEEQASFELCVPDDTCDVPVDRATAEAALDACASALLAYEDGSEQCYLLGYWGAVPGECEDVLHMAPPATPEDKR